MYIYLCLIIIIDISIGHNLAVTCVALNDSLYMIDICIDIHIDTCKEIFICIYIYLY
jgi:hypothetical protein